MNNKFRSSVAIAILSLALIGLVASCGGQQIDSITSAANGEIIMNLSANASGGGSPFDGTIDSVSDLEALVETAWGDGSLDLHRGHAPVQSVLEAFLGISHDNMHTFMEDLTYNLSDVCTHFGFEPENLVATLTFSFDGFLDTAIENGVITESQRAEWRTRFETEFRNRVNWRG